MYAGTSYTLSDAFTGGTWSSSMPAYATIGSASGIVSGVAAGTTTITYSVGSGCTATTVVTVNPLPSAITGAASVCAGVSVSESDGGGGGWSTGSGNITVGSSTGMVTGVSGGTAIVTYTLPTGCIATKTITVNASPGAITGPVSVCVGAGVSESESGSGGAWSSSSGATATIGSTGSLLGVAAGTATISYTYSGTGCYATKPITVNALPATFTVSGGGSFCAGGAGLHVGLSGSVIGTSYQLFRGTTAGTILTGTGAALDFGPQTVAGTYTVVATSSAGCSRTMSGSATIVVNPLPAPISGPTAVCRGSTITESDAGGGVWSAGGGAVSVGSASGVVSGVAIGSGIITYTLPTGCATTTTVNVSAGPSAIGGAGSVCAGATATLTDSISGGLWSSSTGTAAIGWLSGVVTGVSAGTTTITYSLGLGCTVTKAMTINASPAAITGPVSVCVGASVSESESGSGGAWSSTPAAVATIGSTGSLLGVSAGVATIDYTAAGCAAVKMVTVNPTPGAITGPVSVCVGAGVSESDGAAGGVWNTTSALITIGSATGNITGIMAGTAAITYAIGSCTAMRTITVNAVPVITGATGICTGSTSTLSASISGGVWGAAGVLCQWGQQQA